MRKLIATTAACLGVSLCGIPLLLNAEPIPDDLISRTSLQPKSLAAQGCMRLGVCTDYVVPITSVDVLTDHYGDTWLKPKLKKEMTAFIF